MQSCLEGRIWVRKGAQATGMTASLRIQSSKADSNTWESFTRSGLKLESVRLTWAVETKNCGPKSSFQMKVNFAFNLEIKVPESGGRVEMHRIHVA